MNQNKKHNWSMRGSNSRPWAHKTHALTNWAKRSYTDSEFRSHYPTVKITINSDRPRPKSKSNSLNTTVFWFRVLFQLSYAGLEILQMYNWPSWFQCLYNGDIVCVGDVDFISVFGFNLADYSMYIKIYISNFFHNCVKKHTLPTRFLLNSI